MKIKGCNGRCRLVYRQIMKNSAFVFLLGILSTTAFSQGWTQISDFPGTQRDDGTSFVINNKAYCLTGMQVGFTCTLDGFVLDGGSETWGNMNSLPIGNERQYASSFSYNGFGYLFGGVDCSNTCLKDLWRYDPIFNSWQIMAPIPDSGRMGCSSFVINNKAYIVGGRTASLTIQNKVWEYDITNDTWLQKNNLPFSGTWRGTGFSIDTIGFVCYGIMPSLSFNHLIYTYNKSIDVWTVVSGFVLDGRTYPTSSVINNNACLYGGADSTGIVRNDFIVFNPQIPSLTTYTGIPSSPRKGGMAFSLNNKFYLSTGTDTNNVRLKETWRNDLPVAINEINNLSDYKVYPNPTSGILKISYAKHTKFILQLTELSTGKLIMEKNSSHTADSIEIDLTNYDAGNYLLSFLDERNVPTRLKIVKTQ